MQHDPIGLIGGLNTYIYAEANPLRYIDAYGLNSNSSIFVYGPGGGGVAGGGAVLGIGAIEVILQQLSPPMLAEPIQGSEPKGCPPWNYSVQALIRMISTG